MTMPYTECDSIRAWTTRAPQSALVIRPLPREFHVTFTSAGIELDATALQTDPRESANGTVDLEAAVRSITEPL